MAALYPHREAHLHTKCSCCRSPAAANFGMAIGDPTIIKERLSRHDQRGISYILMAITSYSNMVIPTLSSYVPLVALGRPRIATQSMPITVFDLWTVLSTTHTPHRVHLHSVEMSSYLTSRR